MSAFAHLPLGRPVPYRAHAVSCSIPTIRDLRGYEEKKPETMRSMKLGYPRFVVHPFVRQLADVCVQRAGLSGRKLWLTTTEAVARALQAHLGGEVVGALYNEGELWGVHHAEGPELFQKSKLFLQHTGGFLSSRHAEDLLVAWGGLPEAVGERLHEGADPEAEAWRQISPLFAGAARQDAWFTPNGMSAVHAAFRAVADLQATRGRTLWVQLGWLYLDTIAIMRKFTPAEGGYVQIRQVDDLAALRALFEKEGSRIAGIIAEVPSNPLIQSPDLPLLRELADRHGARLILDPSVASIWSVDLLPYADILVSSLTKYAAHEGDVIAGLVVLNPSGADAAELRRRLQAVVQPIYHRDMARLAVQLPSAAAATARMEAGLREVVRFLESRPEVRAIHWSRAARTGANFARVARDDRACGGMLSFELKVSMERVHDAVRLAKGPSFGMETTLISPFIWLGHYDLVTSENGRRELAENGIDPNLLRLSVGTENPAAIIAELAAALDAARGA